jgi:hypothetical protein
MADTHFWQALSDTIYRAVNLRVITLVGDAQVQGTLERLQVTAPIVNSGTLVTDINIVGGDITTIISEKFLGADHADLRAGHQASVTQAQDIVARNIAVLVSVAKEIANQLGSLPPPSTQAPERTPASGASSAPAQPPRLAS